LKEGVGQSAVYEIVYNLVAAQQPVKTCVAPAHMAFSEAARHAAERAMGKVPSNCFRTRPKDPGRLISCHGFIPFGDRCAAVPVE
jgi:hypothetical protein